MSPYVLLAKEAVESYVKKREMIEPPKEFSNIKSGVFVTVKKDGQLRGCIGTYLPTKENIAEEIIQNAIAAATEDYRFGPIKEEELISLSYTLYILSKPELIMEFNPVKWASPKIRRILFDRVNPKKYGIIVKTRPIFSSKNLGGQVENDVIFNGHMVAKSGLLLPDLEGVDIVEQQLSIACQKGGIDPAKENILIYKFTAEKYNNE